MCLRQRNDENIYGETNAVEMLDKAFEIIYQVKERITCSCVLVECKDDSKVRKIYETYGFKELQKENESLKNQIKKLQAANQHQSLDDETY